MTIESQDGRIVNGQEFEPITRAIEIILQNSTLNTWPDEAKLALTQHLGVDVQNTGIACDFRWKTISTFRDRGNVVVTRNKEQILKVGTPDALFSFGLGKARVTGGYLNGFERVINSLQMNNAGIKEYQRFRSATYRGETASEGSGRSTYPRVGGSQ